MDPSETPPEDSAMDPTLSLQPGPPSAPLPETIAPPPLEKPAPLTFAFHGDATEYFRIWIVNTLLSVLTLGVFSAWAKVRKRRYLRGNTELLGHRFNYTADPRRILIGNLLVVLLFTAYFLFGSVYPAVRVLALLAGLALLPWIVVRSLAFNAHNTVWRGLRFRFHPSLSAAVTVYFLQGILIFLSLGFYYPAWVRARTEMTVSRHRLGTAYFHFTGTSGRFYSTYLAAGGLMIIAALLVGGYTVIITQRHAGHVPSTTQLIPALLVYGVIFYIAKHYVFARLFNHIWTNTSLDQHRFRGSLRSGRWLGLQLTNLGAMIISCGLLYPWAVIRSTRYALASLELHPAGPLEEISRVGGRDGSAVGETAAEFAGLDFGI